MNYILICENQVAYCIAERLQEEITRFDVRADIKTCSGDSLKASFLEEHQIDLLIVIGGNRSGKVIRTANKLDLTVCFIYQFFFECSRPTSIIQSVKYFFSDNIRYSQRIDGSLLLDLVKSQIESAKDLEFSKRVVTVIFADNSNRSRASNLLDSLERHMPDIDLHNACLEESFSDSISLINASSMVLTMDPISAIYALGCNCPSINVKTRRFFKSENSESLSKIILGHSTIKTISYKKTNLIAEEVDKIMNDFNYCAEILDVYQAIKSKIGTSNATRTLGREIVERLESDLSGP